MRPRHCRHSAGGEPAHSGVVRQPGVEDRLDTRLLSQPLGDGQRVLRVRLHPQRECLKPLEKDPGIEGAHGWTRGTQDPVHFFHQRLTADNDAPPHSAPAHPGTWSPNGSPHPRHDGKAAGVWACTDSYPRQKRLVGMGEPGQRIHVRDLSQGLEGVSRNSIRVSGRTAPCHSARSVRSTKVVSTPKRAMYF